MLAARFALCILFLGFTACHNGSESNNHLDTTEKPVDEILEYTEIRNLNLIQTGEELKTLRTNAVSVKSAGKQSKYKIIYAFNSADSTSLKIIQTRVLSNTSNCSAPQMKLFLRNEAKTQEIGLLDQVSLDPETQYAIEAMISPECKDIEMTFDLVVWVGNKAITPKIALVCGGPKSFQATFIMHLNNVTTFSPLVGKEEFLSSRFYCGEKFNFSEANCSGSLDLTNQELGYAYKQVSCKASNASDRKSFTIDFNASDRTATVVCNTNDIETHNETFHTCQSVIIDFKPYDKITNMNNK